MVDVTSRIHKQYSGLDADKASITGGAGDTYDATNTGFRYIWDDNASTWAVSGGIGAGVQFVAREVGTADFTQADFTTDGAWHVDGLDLSAIVPAGSIAINLRVILNDNNASFLFRLRRNAGAGDNNAIDVRMQVSNFAVEEHAIINCDSDRKLDYWTTNEALTSLNIIVLGWWI